MIRNDHTGLVSYNVLVGDSATLTSANALPNTVAVMHIEVYHELDRIPEAVLTIVDGNVASADFEVSDSDLFVPGKHVEIRLGYDTSTETIFKGIIIRIRHTINHGVSRLQVVCKHEAVNMTLGKKSRHYEEVSDSDVLVQLLNENGLSQTSVASTGTQHEQLMQAQVTDWDFMLSRADANGLHCFLGHDGTAVKAIDTAADAVADLRYGRDIFELDTEVDARRQYTALETYSWNYSDQEVQHVSASEAGSPGHGRLTVDALAAMSGKPFEIRTSVYLTLAEQQDLADAKRMRQVMSKIKGKVKFRGNATVRQGTFINLEGVGAHFNGKAFVSAVLHEVEEGTWFTTAVLGGDERFFAERVESGLATTVYGAVSQAEGLHIGVITGIIDPRGEGRVKVRFPVADPVSDGIYARVATLDAGENRGTFFRPEIGDEVIVGLVNGDARQPVILGMLHSTAKPAPWEPETDNHEKGYVSREGVKVVIHDGDKRVVIETPAGRKVTLDDSAGVVSVVDDHGNSLEMDSAGIVVKTAGDLMLEAGGKIALQSMELTLQADTSATLKGSASVTVESSGSAALKGSGTVGIQGGLVTIN